MCSVASHRTIFLRYFYLVAIHSLALPFQRGHCIWTCIYSGALSVETLRKQLLMQFSMNHSETLQTFSPWYRYIRGYVWIIFTTNFAL